MTLESLETLNDEQLQAVIGRAGELLKQHDREHKAKALADARAILAAAGLTLPDMVAKNRRPKATKSPVYQRGFRYFHPSKPELVWNGKGHKPEWLRELEAKGPKAIELAEAITE